MQSAETIDCVLKCTVPAGVVMREVPPPRPPWKGRVAVLHCPNRGCGRFFVSQAQAPAQAAR